MTMTPTQFARRLDAMYARHALAQDRMTERQNKEAAALIQEADKAGCLPEPKES